MQTLEMVVGLHMAFKLTKQYKSLLTAVWAHGLAEPGRRVAVEKPLEPDLAFFAEPSRPNAHGRRENTLSAQATPD